MNSLEFSRPATEEWAWYVWTQMCDEDHHWCRTCWDAPTEAEARELEQYLPGLGFEDVNRPPRLLVHEVTTYTPKDQSR